MPSGDPVHTCHADCPCQTGGAPRPDFLPVEGGLLAGLVDGAEALAAAIQRRMAENAKARESMEPRP